jgi:transcriptional repressor NrdR
MHCPFCSAEDTKVVDSRLSEEGDSVRRRRECLSCHERFTTYERAELRMPQIIKSDERREAFNEDKLRNGLTHALQKRSVESEAIEALIGRVRHKLISAGEREIQSRQLGEWVMRELKDLDPVGYIRFASVYRSFEDLEAFTEELEMLLNEPSPETRRRQLKLIPDNKDKK